MAQIVQNPLVCFHYSCLLCCCNYRSTFPECSTPNHQPAPRRSLNSTSRMAPQRAAPSTAPWQKQSPTAEPACFGTESSSYWEPGFQDCRSYALHREFLAFTPQSELTFVLLNQLRQRLSYGEGQKSPDVNKSEEVQESKMQEPAQLQPFEILHSH